MSSITGTPDPGHRVRRRILRWCVHRRGTPQRHKPHTHSQRYEQMIPSRFKNVWTEYSEAAAEGGESRLGRYRGEGFNEYMKHYNKQEISESIGKYDFQDLIYEHVPHIRDPQRMLPETDMIIVENEGQGTGNYRNNYMMLNREARSTRWGNDDRNSTMYGYHGNDVLIGNRFDNALYGADRAHQYGGSYRRDLDNDYLDGGSGSDKLYSGGGNDALLGGHDDDWLFGGDGHDIMFGNQNEDTLGGGAGNDIIVGGIGSDIMTGGIGDDIFALGYNVLENFDNDVITDFGNGYDAIVFDKSLADLGITAEADQQDSIILFKSEETNTVVLEVHVQAEYVGLYDDGIRVLGPGTGVFNQFYFDHSGNGGVSAGDSLINYAVQDFLSW